MKRIIACSVVLASVLVSSPAQSQTGRSGWSPTEAAPVESAGEVVLRFTATDPGRIVYYTLDGDCNRNPWVEDPNSPLPPADCGRPQARASEDYGATKGEWIFTGPGSRTITIPILDDDLDEVDGEPFGVHASHHDDVAGQTTWYAAVIRIVDDDPSIGSVAPPAVTTSVPPDDDRTSISPVPPTVPQSAAVPPPAAVAVPRAPAPAALALPDVEVELPSRDLRPGPGFELVLEPTHGRASEREHPRSGSASPLALSLGSTALASSGFVWLRRRRRWSPSLS